LGVILPQTRHDDKALSLAFHDANLPM